MQTTIGLLVNFLFVNLIHLFIPWGYVFGIIGIFGIVSGTLLVWIRKLKDDANTLKHNLHEKDEVCTKLKTDAKRLKNEVSELREAAAFQKQQFAEQENKIRLSEERFDEEVLNRTGKLQTALEKSQESNRLKEVFLEKISREVRTPLNAILGFINLLNDPNLSKIDGEYYFKFIRESGNNLLALIDNIVDFTKIETGELRIEERKCNLNLLLGDLVDKYRNRVLRENPDVTIFYNKSNVEDSLLDGKRVISVIDQLINNAVKFTERGKVEINYSVKGGFHVIVVSDTGIGIEEKYEEIIFERFYQIEPESRDVFQGAGLGLTIAKGIVDLLNGTIDVESTLNVGTTLTVRIPFKEIISEGKSVEVFEQNPDWSDKLILIAEDEDSNFYFLEAILRKTGVKILRAEDGVKFLEIVGEKKDIDLVLLDIKMPGINGINAIKVVRQQNISIPVIAQTAFNQAEDKQKCLDSGCDDYLAKPIDRELLLTKISHFFS